MPRRDAVPATAATECTAARSGRSTQPPLLPALHPWPDGFREPRGRVAGHSELLGSLETNQAPFFTGAAKEPRAAVLSRAVVLRRQQAIRGAPAAAGVGERQQSVFVAPGCQVSVALPGELWALTSVHVLASVPGPGGAGHRLLPAPTRQPSFFCSSCLKRGGLYCSHLPTHIAPWLLSGEGWGEMLIAYLAFFARSLGSSSVLVSFGACLVEWAWCPVCYRYGWPQFLSSSLCL